jgi:hypothetical protein
MEGNSPKIEWYLARNGEQYGPLTDAEMRKFVELGHLRDGDLVWRAGFTEWRKSSEVFGAGDNGPGPSPLSAGGAGPVAGASREPRAPRGADPRSSKPSRSTGPATPRGTRDSGLGRALADHGNEDPHGGVVMATERTRPVAARRKRGSGVGRAFGFLLLLGLLGGGAWLVWDNRDRLGSISELGALVATASNNPSEASLRVSPFEINGNTADAVEASLQRSAVWQIAKRDFPEWYAAKTDQVGKLVAENGDERTVARLLAESLVELRRQHASSALSAPLPALRKVAASFVGNLSELNKLGSQQCFGFISYGEGTPLVVELSRTPAHAEHLQRQMVAVLEAANEGRKAQFAPTPARRADYDMLSWELAKRNWTREDLLTFSDPKRLAALPPEGVCKMVLDWFSAQLDVRDEDVQTRLLSASLKPLVEG